MVSLSQNHLFHLQDELTRAGVELPEFRKLGGMLADGDGGGGRGGGRADQRGRHEAIFEGIFCL